MTEKEKMLAGKLYFAGEEKLARECRQKNDIFSSYLAAGLESKTVCFF